MTSFSKWLPGGHIRYFGFLMAWFRLTQVCFGISVSNFMCMSFVAVGRSLTIVSYVAFKMAALWFWTMFNCNPPITHCHPLLWGGGILVDHWSTISSFNMTRVNCGQEMLFWCSSKHLLSVPIWMKMSDGFCPKKTKQGEKVELIFVRSGISKFWNNISFISKKLKRVTFQSCTYRNIY